MGLKDPCMTDIPLRSQNFFLACYVRSLMLGETIQGTKIKFKTVKNYIGAALKLFRNRNLLIPRSNQYENSRSNQLLNIDYLNIVLTAIESYENIPNRKNMITDKMCRTISELAANKPAVSLEAALYDWITLGRYTGFQKSEWCQDSQTEYEKCELKGSPARAMLMKDFKFKDKHQNKIKVTPGINIDPIHELHITWKTQKSKQNGQTIPYKRDDVNTRFCPVRAGVRIILRALNLKVQTHHPIGVFKHAKERKYSFITDPLTSNNLRKAANIAYNITDIKELEKWTSHSIRVTAANLLHMVQFSNSFIQSRLRWKSDSFLMYLRNTIYCASEHLKAITLSDSNLPPMHLRKYREQGDDDILWGVNTAKAA